MKYFSLKRNNSFVCVHAIVGNVNTFACLKTMESHGTKCLWISLRPQFPAPLWFTSRVGFPRVHSLLCLGRLRHLAEYRNNWVSCWMKERDMTLSYSSAERFLFFLALVAGMEHEWNRERWQKSERQRLKVNDGFSLARSFFTVGFFVVIKLIITWVEKSLGDLLWVWWASDLTNTSTALVMEICFCVQFIVLVLSLFKDRNGIVHLTTMVRKWNVRLDAFLSREICFDLKFYYVFCQHRLRGNQSFHLFGDSFDSLPKHPSYPQQNFSQSNLKFNEYKLIRER